MFLVDFPLNQFIDGYLVEDPAPKLRVAMRLLGERWGRGVMGEQFVQPLANVWVNHGEPQSTK